MKAIIIPIQLILEWSKGIRKRINHLIPLLRTPQAVKLLLQKFLPSKYLRQKQTPELLIMLLLLRWFRLMAIKITHPSLLHIRMICQLQPPRPTKENILLPNLTMVIRSMILLLLLSPPLLLKEEKGMGIMMLIIHHHLHLPPLLVGMVLTKPTTLIIMVMIIMVEVNLLLLLLLLLPPRIHIMNTIHQIITLVLRIHHLLLLLTTAILLHPNLPLSHMGIILTNPLLHTPTRIIPIHLHLLLLPPPL